MKLGDLAAADVPLLHVCGSIDPILGKYSPTIESIYQQFGGRISVMIKDGAGHHPHSLRDPKPIADFIEQSVQPAAAAPPRHIWPAESTKTSFYSIENSYRDFPKEGTLHHLPRAVVHRMLRPLFIRAGRRGGSDHSHRAEERGGRESPGSSGPILSAATRWSIWPCWQRAFTSSPGRCRTTPTARRCALERRLQASDRARLFQEAGAWKGPAARRAKLMPGRSKTRTRSPASTPRTRCSRSTMSKTQPLDNLAPLAKAGVPLLHVCGSLDPCSTSQTRVAEKRYKDLGGKITVIIKEGEGHYPTAPKDPKPVVDFILGLKRQNKCSTVCVLCRLARRLAK